MAPAAPTPQELYDAVLKATEAKNHEHLATMLHSSGISRSTLDRLKRGEAVSGEHTIILLHQAGWLVRDGDQPRQLASDRRLELLAAQIAEAAAEMARIFRS